MLVSQRTFAKMIGRSHPYIGKLVKSGVIELINGKIEPESAKIAIQENQDPAREAQREANAKRRENKDLFAVDMLPKVAMSQEDFAAELAAERAKLDKVRSEAAALGANTADEEFNIDMSLNEIRQMKEYYAAKIQQIQYQRETGELITIESVRKDAQTVATIITNKLLAIPNKVAPRVYGMGIGEIQHALTAAINEVLAELHRREF